MPRRRNARLCDGAQWLSGRGKLLGIVMGTMVEQSFITSLIKSDGSIFPFFSRPVATVLAAMTMAALFWPVGVWLWRGKAKSRRRAASVSSGV